MKLVFIIYFLIGLLFSPFVYYNNANTYRSGSTAFNIGQSIGSSVVFWPSYIFAWEPEINGNSEDEFTNSIHKMALWRNDKLFTGKKTGEHHFLLISSIGLCIFKEGASESKDQAFQKIFGKNKHEFSEKNIELTSMKNKIMKRFDGMDFRDVIDEGQDCIS